LNKHTWSQVFAKLETYDVAIWRSSLVVREADTTAISEPSQVNNDKHFEFGVLSRNFVRNDVNPPFYKGKVGGVNGWGETIKILFAYFQENFTFGVLLMLTCRSIGCRCICLVCLRKPIASPRRTCYWLFLINYYFNNY